MAPFGRLLGDPRQEPRAAGVSQAGGAHEFEPGFGAGGFLVRVNQAQHGCRRTGEAQLVGEHIADQPRAFVRGPALRHIAHAKMAQIEGIGIDRANLGDAVVDLPGGAEPLGRQQHAVLANHQLDVAADRLRGDRIVRVVSRSIFLRRGGWRGQIVDQRD